MKIFFTEGFYNYLFGVKRAYMTIRILQLIGILREIWWWWWRLLDLEKR